MSRYKNSLMGIVVAGVLFSGAAHAGTVSPSLNGSVVVSEGSTTNASWIFNDTYIDNGDGTFTYAGVNGNQTIWTFEWDITVNPDPLISAMFAITNNTASTQHFDILFTLPVGSPFGTPAVKSGSLAAGFQDLNNSGSVTLSNIDWDGRIDGSDAMSLFSGDFSCGGAGCSGNIFPVSDGPLSSTGVNTSIGIHLAFDLTAGDKATFDTFFEVEPVVVPIPAAVWLFGSGLLGLAALARRRKN
jgi:hypothetical protein